MEKQSCFEKNAFKVSKTERGKDGGATLSLPNFLDVLLTIYESEKNCIFWSQ